MLILIIAIIFMVIAVGVIYKPNFSELIDKCAWQYNVESALVSAIILQESKFKASAVSSKGAIGLMQLLPSTASWIADKYEYGDYDLYSPKDNISLGCIYINYLNEKYNDLDTVIIAYNAGEGRVNDWLQLIGGELVSNIPFSETRQYHSKVMNNLIMYRLIS